MDDVVKLPVEYKGEELEFDMRILRRGYTLRFVVLVNDAEVIFERDEQGEYRAIVLNADEHNAGLIPQDLLAAIHKSIEVIGA